MMHLWPKLFKLKLIISLHNTMKPMTLPELLKNSSKLLKANSIWKLKTEDKKWQRDKKPKIRMMMMKSET